MRLDFQSSKDLYAMRQNRLELLTCYSDGSVNFCCPVSPSLGEKVKVRFRALSGFIFNIELIVYGKTISMKEVSKKGRFSYFEAEFVVREQITYYYFRFTAAGELYRYGSNKVCKDIRKEDCFKLVSDFNVPDWAKGTKIYQIFTDRFYNGDKSNDVVSGEYSYIKRPVIKKEDWYSMPEGFDVCNFYGGDLKGIYEKLDYLQELGVDVLYLNPIFVSPSNHKYDTQDYDHVDPHLGVIVNDLDTQHNFWTENNDNADLYIKRVTDPENLRASDAYFAEFTKEVHRRGMKIILDGVFNHCGSFNKWMDKERIYENSSECPGAAYDKNSPYREYFYFDDEDDSYLGWWNHDTLPKLRYKRGEALYNEILRIAEKWVSPPYSVDGWRLDVAADLGNDDETNHTFWRDFRQVVKKANPHALILAEHYGNPAPWLDGTMWDSIMNYDAFMEPVSWFLTGLEKHSDFSNFTLKNNVPLFWERMLNASNNLPYPALASCMNELSNHDHSRFLTRTNGMCGRVSGLGPYAAGMNVNHAIMRAAVIIQFTWLGNPTIYYGDEAALCGFTDPDNRRSYPWGKEDEIMLEFHKDISKLYESYPMLRDASLTRLACDNNALLCYARFNLDEQIIVIINNTESEITSDVLLSQAGICDSERLERLFCSYEIGYHRHPMAYTCKKGVLNINVSPHSAVILHHEEAYDTEGADE